MNLSIHWITHKLVEVKVDEIETSILNQAEAREMARNLISIADELLSVESN